MSIPGNLEDIMQHLKQAADVLNAAALVAEENTETKAIAALLLRMSKEADGYSEYIHSYFKPLHFSLAAAPVEARSFVDAGAKNSIPRSGGTRRFRRR